MDLTDFVNLVLWLLWILSTWSSNGPLSATTWTLESNWLLKCTGNHHNNRFHTSRGPKTHSNPSGPAGVHFLNLNPFRTEGPISLSGPKLQTLPGEAPDPCRARYRSHFLMWSTKYSNFISQVSEPNVSQSIETIIGNQTAKLIRSANRQQNNHCNWE